MSAAAQETTAGGGDGKRQGPRRPGYLKLGYHIVVSNAVYVLLAPFAAALALRASRLTLSDLDAARAYLLANLQLAVSLVSVATALATVYLARRPRAVYLLDFACYKPGPDHVGCSV